uniref:RNase H type-1 domain-containing protein n=1 Tax=Rhizophagus irregularis (strain DAOM 181602 / DAOM 197198 / MUCL 43194) TaxID=747089 RepID=U9TY93_RHIID
MDIKNVLAERTMVEYYTDGSLRPSIPTSRDKQYPNLVYIKMGATFCVNDKPALSAQANLSLWSSSTHSELVAIFLALLTNPMNINILLQEKKMKLVLVKVKGHRRDVMNEMVDKLTKNTSTILLQRKPNLYKEFVCPRCNANKEENRHHFIECEANKDLWPIIKSRMQNDVISIIQKWSNTTEDTPKIINKKLNQILGTQHDNNKFFDFCSLALEAKINTNFSKISKQIFGFLESKNNLFLVLLLDSFIIH